MYYIVEKESETGKKLQAIVDKKQECHKAVVAFADKYGFGEWRPDRMAAIGGISSCCSFKEEPLGSLWKQVGRGEYMPKRNNKKAKVISEELMSLPVISRRELNMCIGYNSMFNSIGFVWSNKKFFGISIDEKWEFEPPQDCLEVTYTRYKEMFQKKEVEQD